MSRKEEKEMKIIDRVNLIEQDFIRTGFGSFSLEEKFERAAAIGASNERLRLSKHIDPDLIYGVGGD